MDLLEVDEESWQRVLSVNLEAPQVLTQELAKRWIANEDPGRLQHGRKLLFVGSISAEVASTSRGEYCVAKAGLAMLQSLWAVRLAEHGVQSCELRLGIMKSDMTAAVADRYEPIVTDRAIVPMARWGEGADVGRAVRAFLDGAFSFSTGDVLRVDGGFHLRSL